MDLGSKQRRNSLSPNVLQFSSKNVGFSNEKNATPSVGYLYTWKHQTQRHGMPRNGARRLFWSVRVFAILLGARMPAPARGIIAKGEDGVRFWLRPCRAKPSVVRRLCLPAELPSRNKTSVLAAGDGPTCLKHAGGAIPARTGEAHVLATRPVAASTPRVTSGWIYGSISRSSSGETKDSRYAVPRIALRTPSRLSAAKVGPDRANRIVEPTHWVKLIFW